MYSYLFLEDNKTITCIDISGMYALGMWKVLFHVATLQVFSNIVASKNVA